MFMIEKYQIKQLNDEEVLYLYLNYSYEFGNFFKRDGFSDIKERVKSYIVNMRINFKGTKILLVIGGIGLLTIFLTPNDITEIEDLSSKYISSSVVQKVVDFDNNYFENIKIENNVIIESDINEVEDSSVLEDNISNEETIKFDDTINVHSNTNDIEVPKEDVVPDVKEEVSVEEVVPQNLVTIHRSNGSIMQIPFEDYIVGVVAAEMPASFPIEALKAQAVVARTYANQRLSKGLILTDSVSTQSYKDEGQLRSMWGSSYDTYYSKIKSAVDATKNLSIYYNGNYIDAVYHSTSNGYTEDAINVWGNSIPYLKSVASPWDTSATSYFRVEEKSEQVLLNTLGFSLTNDTVVEIISRDASGRVAEVRIGDLVCDGVSLRNILGLRSADFDLEVKDGNLVVTTRGYGHGVGMSQYGAAGMAREGYSYIDILKHYYTGVSIY